MIRILSLGAGVQSSTLALMIAAGEVAPIDAAIFADTGAEPPTGNGKWKTDKVQSVKDRWVDALRPDDRRASLLAVKDASIERRGIPKYADFIRQGMTA